MPLIHKPNLEEWRKLGFVARSLVAVLAAFEIVLRLGIGVSVAGALALIVTGGSHVAIVLFGVGLFLILLGALPRL